MELTINKDLGVTLKSNLLENKKIALAVCGGIAAVETVKLARELRRHGATVRAYLSETALKFITPLSLEWGTAQSVVTEFKASADHLYDYDLVIVAPLTLSSLNKIAVGIADSPVTLLIATQLGLKRKMILFPTMNEAMAHHPLFDKNCSLLKDWGCRIFIEEIQEERLKIPTPEKIVEEIFKYLEISKEG